MRVVGFDLSLTASGWAVADLDNRQVRTGRVTSKAPPKDVAERIDVRSRRLRRVAGDLFHVVSSERAGLVLVEGPAYDSGTGHAHDRSGLWWLVAARLTGAGIPVAEVTPATIKTFATGKGNAPKDAVLVAAVRTFPAVTVNDNNEADALWLAALAARRLGAPIDPWPVLPKDRARALGKVSWPPQIGDPHHG